MRLNEFFKKQAALKQPLVLVTVFETAGSTYSKAGGQMIIDGDGNFCGMLSGGCLEGDLVERARTVMQTGNAATASYDLGADDELWGLGVGCDGTMRVLLQPLAPEFDYQPFAAIAEVLNGGAPSMIAFVIRSECASIRPGASVVLKNGVSNAFGMRKTDAALIAGAANKAEPARMHQVSTSEGDCTVLYTEILPSPSLLILGAGLDSEPVARFAYELGWRCTVHDHRPAYIENRCYPNATTTMSGPLEGFAERVDIDAFELALVMSHHLASDREYLRQLSATSIGYIGLLGPANRHDRLIDELGADADALRGRLHGPAGIRLGGRGPGPIALEIIAEMQQFLSQCR